MFNYSDIHQSWRNDDRQTKYKLGDRVYLAKEESFFTVIGVNTVSENEVEYALDIYPYLVWEDEITKKEG